MNQHEDIQIEIHEWLSKIRPQLVYYATLKLPTSLQGDAEDVVQKAIIEFIIRWDLVQSLTERQRQSWLFKAVANKAVDAVRKKFGRGQAEVQWHPLTTAIVDDASRSMASNSPAIDLEELLANLPPDLRAVVELRIQGYGNREIAEQLGVNESTVWRRMRKIREMLEGGADDESL